MTDIRETIARAICPATEFWCEQHRLCEQGVEGTPPCIETFGAAADAVLSAIEAAGWVIVPASDEARRGLEWFERTFSVPLGDKPGLHDVQRVRAMIAAAPPLANDKA